MGAGLVLACSGAKARAVDMRRPGAGQAPNGSRKRRALHSAGASGRVRWKRGLLPLAILEGGRRSWACLKSAQCTVLPVSRERTVPRGRASVDALRHFIASMPPRGRCRSARASGVRTSGVRWDRYTAVSFAPANRATGRARRGCHRGRRQQGDGLADRHRCPRGAAARSCGVATDVVVARRLGVRLRRGRCCFGGRSQGWPLGAAIRVLHAVLGAPRRVSPAAGRYRALTA